MRERHPLRWLFGILAFVLAAVVGAPITAMALDNTATLRPATAEESETAHTQLFVKHTKFGKKVMVAEGDNGDVIKDTFKTPTTVLVPHGIEIGPQMWGYAVFVLQSVAPKTAPVKQSPTTAPDATGSATTATSAPASKPPAAPRSPAASASGMPATASSSPSASASADRTEASTVPATAPAPTQKPAPFSASPTPKALSPADEAVRKSYTNGRLMFDWGCYGEVINMVDNGTCLDINRQAAAQQEMDKHSHVPELAEFNQIVGFTNITVEGDGNETTKQGKINLSIHGKDVLTHNLRVADGNLPVTPRMDEQGILMLDGREVITGGELGLWTVLTQDFFARMLAGSIKEADVPSLIFYDPVCTGLKGILVSEDPTYPYYPLEDYLDPETLEYYKHCRA